MKENLRPGTVGFCNIVHFCSGPLHKHVAPHFPPTFGPGVVFANSNIHAFDVVVCQWHDFDVPHTQKKLPTYAVTHPQLWLLHCT